MSYGNWLKDKFACTCRPHMHLLNLDGILGSIPIAVFLREYFGKFPVYLPGAMERFAPLLGGLDRYAQGDRVDRTHDASGLLAGRLERAIEADVEIHLCSGAGDALDTELDLMVLQLCGESKWSVIGKASVGEPPVLKGTLRQGDALCVPHGWRLETSGEKAFALRITFHNPTGAQLAAWLIELLRGNEAMQLDIPRFGAPGEQADFVRNVRRPIVQALRSPWLLEAYARHCQGTALPRAIAGVPWRDDLSPERHWIELTCTRRLRVRRADRDRVFIIVGGKQLTFPDDASPLLHYLSDRAPVSIARFYHAFRDEFDVEELADFLAALSRDAVIVVLESNAE